ncbi:unnamed protein product [Mytilus edulis]|uniref:Uncharacterized protein n=1 Tax=Mytilus edulis TaxID=6550 RepID=A0A8S3RM78_MYTED|nr:unnamed protein product [Mytilus edulis]
MHRCSPIIRYIPTSLNPQGCGRQISNGKNTTLTNVLSSYQDFQLRPLRVGALSFGKRYGGSEVFSYIENNSRQFVREEFLTDQDVNQNAISTYSVDFESIFSKGFDVIRDTNIVDDNRQNLVLNLLNEYLCSLEYHEGCLSNYVFNNYNNISEPEMSAVFVTHILSHLVQENKLGNTCTVKVNYKNKPDQCPCNICQRKVHYGKTTFGNRYIWYSRPDIMLFPGTGGHCQIFVKKRRTTSCEYDPTQLESLLDNEAAFLRRDSVVKQAVCQAITFAFYQRRYQIAKNWNSPDIVTAIPTIVLNPFCFDVYIYDPQHDVLLRNFDQPIPFWRQSESNPKQKVLNKSSLLQLWLMMNHLVFKPQFTKDGIIALGGTAGFLSQVDSVRMERLEEMMNLGLPAKAKDFKLSEFKSTIPAYHISCRDNQEQRYVQMMITLLDSLTNLR